MSKPLNVKIRRMVERFLCAVLGHTWNYTYEYTKYCIRCHRIIGSYDDKVRGQNIGGEE